MRTAGMPPLRFRCCGWETPGSGRTGILRRRDGERFEVSMTSDETVVRSRSQWKAIPFFHVTVVHLLEQP